MPKPILWLLPGWKIIWKEKGKNKWIQEKNLLFLFACLCWCWQTLSFFQPFLHCSESEAQKGQASSVCRSFMGLLLSKSQLWGSVAAHMVTHRLPAGVHRVCKLLSSRAETFHCLRTVRPEGCWRSGSWVETFSWVQPNGKNRPLVLKCAPVLSEEEKEVQWQSGDLVFCLADLSQRSLPKRETTGPSRAPPACWPLPALQHGGTRDGTASCWSWKPQAAMLGHQFVQLQQAGAAEKSHQHSQQVLEVAAHFSPTSAASHRSISTCSMLNNSPDQLSTWLENSVSSQLTIPPEG